MSAISGSSRLPSMSVPIHGLHHFAYRCRDAEETRHFYEDILGLPLVHLIRAENVPSTGEHCPYVHLFFEMKDGSCVAFFDLGDDTAAVPSPNTPQWVNHLALRVGSLKEVEDAKATLEAHGVEVVGITDHHFVKSIYFFDPNGIRLELTYQDGAADYIAQKHQSAHAELAAWNTEKEALRQADMTRQAA